MFEESGWVNRIITAGIIAMIGWTLFTVLEVSVDLAVLQEKMTNFDTTLKLAQETRYTSTAADAAHALLEQRILRNEQVLDRLTTRLERLEQ